jgi:hypothetical protein
MMKHPVYKKIFLLIFFSAAPFFCTAEDIGSSSHFTIDKGCGITITDAAAGSITCKEWQRGSQAAVSEIDVAACICANTCVGTPKNHYYYDDPVAKTRQTNENSITLPVVLAWDDVMAWKKEDGEYLLYYSGAGAKGSVTSPVFGARSYLLEIDNHDYQINDSGSLKGIFRQILTTNEFNPTEKFYPCFFNSGRTIKWRVRPCCTEDGQYCLPEDQAPWWTFTTSYAPEPAIAKDPDWNGNSKTTGIAFKGFQIKWCRVYLWEASQFAKSYQLMVASDEKGAGTLNCHPLLVSNGQCRATGVPPDGITGEVYAVTTDADGSPKIPYPIAGRQDLALFTRDRTYAWKVKTCFDNTASNCSDYGQTWKFSTRTDPIGIPAANEPKNDPSGNTPVGLPVSLSWTIPDGANSFVYEASFISGERDTAWPVVPNNGSSDAEKKLFDADNLKPDTQYKWRARACSQFNSQNCDGWSSWFSFLTTGRPPKADSLAVSSGIPATFSWEPVPGAKSYIFSLTKKGGGKTVLVNDAEAVRQAKQGVGYPDLDQAQSYSWKVQTCAHADGTVCGAWSAEKNFSTPKLTEVSNIKPADNSTVWTDQLTQNISWNAVNGASAYHFTLELAVSAEKEPCEQSKVEKTVTLTAEMAKLNCLGKYKLAIQPCVDAKCESVGPESRIQFTLDQRTPKNKSVFAVCNTTYNDPDTPWNERETCQPKHLLLLIKIGLDFTLFKLAVLLLPLLALITGLLFYSHFKTPEIWEKVKLMWKAIGIGYALLIFAWLIVGLLLQLIGFSGLWFKIL